MSIALGHPLLLWKKLLVLFHGTMIFFSQTSVVAMYHLNISFLFHVDKNIKAGPKGNSWSIFEEYNISNNFALKRDHGYVITSAYNHGMPPEALTAENGCCQRSEDASGPPPPHSPVLIKISVDNRPLNQPTVKIFFFFIIHQSILPLTPSYCSWKKQLIWVFEWRKSVHYWWSYILFSP